MSGQEQIKLKRKPVNTGCDSESGTDDMTGRLPDIDGVMAKIKKVKKKLEKPCHRPGVCDWASICDFECEFK